MQPQLAKLRRQLPQHPIGTRVGFDQSEHGFYAGGRVGGFRHGQARDQRAGIPGRQGAGGLQSSAGLLVATLPHPDAPELNRRLRTQRGRVGLVLDDLLQKPLAPTGTLEKANLKLHPTLGGKVIALPGGHHLPGRRRRFGGTTLGMVHVSKHQLRMGIVGRQCRQITTRRHNAPRSQRRGGQVVKVLHRVQQTLRRYRLTLGGHRRLTLAPHGPSRQRHYAQPDSKYIHTCLLVNARPCLASDTISPES